jgi:PEGA domain
MHKLPIVLASAVFAGLALSPVAHGADKSDKYQMGIFVSAGAVSDGTVTDNFNCGDESLGGSTVCSGGVRANGVLFYQVRVAGGIWSLETYRDALDSAMRQTFGQQPTHFKSERQNPLDLLKNGDRVLFRVEQHRKLRGVEEHLYIPFADNPNKEVDFLATFVPDSVAPSPQRPSDNVRAMCDAHKLSPELEKQFCTPATKPAAPDANLQTPANSETVAPSSGSIAGSGEASPPTDPQEVAQMVQSGLASWCEVNTAPSGAEIYVDGKTVGVAPIAFVLLKHGDTPRIITIKMDGYKTIERQVIPEGNTIPLVLTLETQ